jgi:hypothetical protein
MFNSRVYPLSYSNASWRYHDALIEWNILIQMAYITVPVSTVTITPAVDYNVVDIVEGDTQTFTCTTDSSRPAAWIQWYIGGQNVTNQATPQPPPQKTKQKKPQQTPKTKPPPPNQNEPTPKRALTNPPQMET